MKWLVTAFEPFAGAQSNSSLIVLEKLKDQNEFPEIEFLAPLPVRFSDGWKALSEHLERNEYAGVLALGQAEGQAHVRLERVALNWIDARVADNAGVTPPIGKIKNGADVFWSEIPWDQFSTSALCRKSYSAGTFVCNELMYHLLEWSKKKGVLAGFVHVPLVESQTDAVFAGQMRVSDQDVVDEVTRILHFVSEL
jgi:pyroglutamyl-peptidase